MLVAIHEKRSEPACFHLFFNSELYRHLITYARVLVPDEGELNVAVVVQTRNGGVELPNWVIVLRSWRSKGRAISVEGVQLKSGSSLVEADAACSFW